MPFMSRLGQGFDLMQVGNVLSLDRGEFDVMSNLARGYSARKHIGYVVDRVHQEGLKTEFHKATVSINPAFAMYNAADL